MILEADPVRDLGVVGEPWMGVVYPGVALTISVALSFFLYWHFVRKRRHEEP
ncbi:MAG TPA: hypothetical protein VI818_01155 [Candidatus Thermoplasmatota archaeon]|nr:hypothetical protein [Candidatus Thermoplasmatota archaeon]